MALAVRRPPPAMRRTPIGERPYFKHPLFVAVFVSERETIFAKLERNDRRLITLALIRRVAEALNEQAAMFEQRAKFRRREMMQDGDDAEPPTECLPQLLH